MLDADQTILDFKRSEADALHRALAGCGVECTPEIHMAYHKINDELWKALEVGTVTRERLKGLRFERLAEQFGLSGVQDMAAGYVKWLSKCAYFLPGAEAFLEKACKLADIAIVTNGITTVQQGRLGLLGIERFAKAVVISDACGISKPDRRLADIALEKLGCTDNRLALVVGDSLSADIALGINANIDTCLMFDKSDKATYCANGYSEVLALL